MKGKKLLAGLLSAAMVLSTMVMPVFADDVSDSDEFKAAVKSGKSTITLTQDVTVNATSGEQVLIFNRDCTIDLAGHTLTRNVNYFGVSGGAKVKFTSSKPNGTISMGSWNADQAFLVTKGTLTFENITADKGSLGSNCMAFVDTQYADGDVAFNFDNCTLNLSGISNVVRCIYGSTTYNKTVNINDTTMKSGSKTIWGGDTVVVSGTSEIKGSIVGVTKIYKAGDAELPSGTTATPLAAAVTNAAGTTTNYYENFDTAWAALTDGDVLKLYKDVGFGQNTQFKNSIDLNGNTMKMTGTDSDIYGDITFSNGYITADELQFTSNGIFLTWYGNLTFEKIEFTCNNLQGGGAFVIDAGAKTFTAKNSTFNFDGLEYKAAFGGANNTSVFEDCTITIKNTDTGILYNATLKNTTYNAENLKNAFKTGVNNKITLDNSTVNVKDCDYSIYMKYDNSTFEATNGSKILTAEGSSKDAEIYITGGNIVSFKDTSDFDGTTNAVAKIDKVYYATLDAAFEAATDGQTITLVNDAETAKGDGGSAITKATKIDLDDHTLTLKNDDIIWGKMEFYNGTIDVETTYASTAIFYMWDPNSELTFDTITVNADNLTGCYLIGDGYADPGSRKLTIKNSTINVNTNVQGNNALSAVIAYNTAGNTAEIIDSTINHKNSTEWTFLVQGASDVEISGDDSVINSDNVGAAAYLGTDASFKIKDKATINAANLVATPYSTGEYGIILAENTVYDKANTATVNAKVYRPVTVNNAADALKLELVEVENSNKAQKSYKLVLKPTENTKVINDFKSAALALDFSACDGTYNIVGAENISVQKDDGDGRVSFYYNGTNNVSGKTGVEIELGTITFSGYGAYGVALGTGSFVVTIDAAAAGYDEKTITDITMTALNDTIDIPTHTLTINIDFANSVEDQCAAYTDMTVKVTAPDIDGQGAYEKTIQIGNEQGDDNIVNIVDNKVKIELTDRIYDTVPYTVEITGGGYRTASYTVTMDADKELNFWNDAKRTAAKIEAENDDAEKVAANFLAGEFVEDGVINIFDLSAVVSYFGKKGIETDRVSKYSKYDLNRDGKINAKDVAYVLASWGN